MALKPWYKVITPREDLREGRPTDASEFAVHLDKVRTGQAPPDYQDPRRFFERTYLTETLRSFAAEVVARLSGKRVETNAVFNLTTQFGGGKTHALTLVYHLARCGQKAVGWPGVMEIAGQAGVPAIPQAATAIFVGTEFDSLTGRGGNDGTPLRRTPWGEIAWQLGGERAFAIVRKHDEKMVAPAGDVIQAFLPKDTPCLILIDELINYTSRSRELKTGLADQMYTFIHSLSEVARSSDSVVLAISIPASELEMTPADVGDYQRLEKLLERVGKAYIMSAKSETAEIIRRRLFEWTDLPHDAKNTIAEYADWIRENRTLVPSWFPVDHAYEVFEATYPFHPMVISVFERKWQTLPAFQQTRGVLKLMALWVSHLYQKSFRRGMKDPLITLGSAPLDEPLFRAALLKQVGEGRFEGVITTDICGNSDSHAQRLDEESGEPIRSLGLHRAVATTIFFESNGGQPRTVATLPEIRLAIGGPGLDSGNIDTVLEALAPPRGSCFFMNKETNDYRFGIKTNLIKTHADRKASIQSEVIRQKMEETIKNVFDQSPSLERVYFPKCSGDIMDRPVVTLVVLPPSMDALNAETQRCALQCTKYHGKSGRTYKSSLIWAIASNAGPLTETIRDYLAWCEIRDDTDTLNLDDAQKRQAREYVETSKRQMKEQVWESYNVLGLYTPDDTIRLENLGRINSSASTSITKFITHKLKELDQLTDTVNPNYLVRNWSPISQEWSTRQVRDAFFASPRFPRVISQEVIKRTIVRGVSDGVFGYAGVNPLNRYEPFYFNQPMSILEVEISDDTSIIPREVAESVIQEKEMDTTVARIEVRPPETPLKPGQKQEFRATLYNAENQTISSKKVCWKAIGGEITENGVFEPESGYTSFGITASCDDVTATVTGTVSDNKEKEPEEMEPEKIITSLELSGEIPHRQWANFYRRVLSRFSNEGRLTVNLEIEIEHPDGIPLEKIEDVRVALRELGLNQGFHLKERHSER
ncbi:MAG: ATP-binding protein [Methanoculleus sp.]|jgi:hypothetical protein|nr:ATP-binding protein [Methanoculleus sp.]